MEGNYPWPQEAPQPPAPPLYNEFLERGREGRNDVWRYLLGVVISFGGYFLFSIPALVVITKLIHDKGISDPDEMQRMITNPEYLGIDPNLLLFLLLLCFPGAIIGLFLAVKFVHGKAINSIITSAKRIRWSRVAIGGLVLFLLSGAWMLVALNKDPENIRWTFQMKPFLISLFIGIVFLPAQTWWEEFMMRGYLLQRIGLVTKTAWLPVLITSIAFALLHMGNPEVAANGFLQSMPMYIVPGLLFGVIAVLDGGLEIPMGLHFANNLFGTIIVTNDTSAIQASTIWRQNTPDPALDWLGLLLLPLCLGVLWLIYKWDVKKLYK